MINYFFRYDPLKKMTANSYKENYDCKMYIIYFTIIIFYIIAMNKQYEIKYKYFELLPNQLVTFNS